MPRPVGKDKSEPVFDKRHADRDGEQREGFDVSDVSALLRRAELQYLVEVGQLRDELAMLRAALLGGTLPAPQMSNFEAPSFLRESEACDDVPGAFLSPQPFTLFPPVAPPDPVQVSENGCRTPSEADLAAPDVCEAPHEISKSQLSKTMSNDLSKLQMKAKKRFGSSSFRKDPQSSDHTRLFGILETVVGILIVLNIIEQLVRFEFFGHLVGVKQGFTEQSGWPNLTVFFDVIQHVFCLAFFFELLFRLAILKTKYFYVEGEGFQGFNIFDFFIVFVTLFDLYVLSPLIDGSASTNIVALRMLRFMRLFRALRIARSLVLFEKLRILLATVFTSFLCFFWSLVLLFVTMLSASLMICQFTAPYLEDEDVSIEVRRWLYQMYGTSTRAMWSVFELTFSGGWPAYARTTVEDLHPFFAFFWFFYVTTVIFAMTRIITALFLKDTLAVASMDSDVAISEKSKEKVRYAEKLLDFFNEADTSGDGKISWHEFQVALADPKVRTYLSTLELDSSEASTLFQLLDDGDGEIGVEEFVKGAVRLKGMARSQDVIAMMHDVNRMSKMFENNLIGLREEVKTVVCHAQDLHQVAGRRSLRRPLKTSSPVSEQELSIGAAPLEARFVQ